MKFTSEDLMKAMGLQVGDRVKVEDKTLEVYLDNNVVCLRGKDTDVYISYLLDYDFDILPRPKRVGELKCSDDDTLNCTKCPLFVLCHASREYDNKRLYDVLDNWFESSKDKEIYDLLKARLDKEVEE